MTLKATRKLSAHHRRERWNRMCRIGRRNSGRGGGHNNLASSQHCSGATDRPADPGIGSAAADVGYGSIDIAIGRVGIGFEKQRGGHDHARLAISTLRHAFRRPSLLDGVASIARKAFDCCYESPFNASNRDLARSHRAAIDIDGAGAAVTRATTIFRACKVGSVAQGPEQRRLGIHPVFDRLVVDGEFGQNALPACACRAIARARSTGNLLSLKRLLKPFTQEPCGIGIIWRLRQFAIEPLDAGINILA